MTGDQAGKFITVWTRDPGSAMPLARALDSYFSKAGLPRGTLPPGDFVFGESGLIAWRYGSQTGKYSMKDKAGNDIQAIKVKDAQGRERLEPDHNRFFLCQPASGRPGTSA